MSFAEKHKCPRWGKILSAIIATVLVVLLLLDIRLWHKVPVALAIILIAIAVIGELAFYFCWPTGRSERASDEEDEDEVRLASLKSEAQSRRQVAKKNFVQARRARTAYRKANEEYLAFQAQLQEEAEAFEDYLEE